MADGQGQQSGPVNYVMEDIHDYKLYRVPTKLLPILESHLLEHGDLTRAWLQSVAVSAILEGRKLLDVLRSDPMAFPPYFPGEPKFANDIQVCTAQHNLVTKFCYLKLLLN
jgi:hypothetical protein